MRFLLAIHDVWPGNFPLVAGYLERLRGLGARRMALLAVPAFHGGARLDGHAEFIAWLREESGRGTELFLHGYHHLMGELAVPPHPAGRGRNAWGRFVNRRLVDREAEFSGLPRPAQARILSDGLEAWRPTGLPMAGFVAPTWHGSPARRDLRAAGIALWETRFRLIHLPTALARFVPPLAWNLAPLPGEPRLFGGQAWLEFLLRLPLMKVALHPGDMEGRATEKVLARVIEMGDNVAYGDVFA